MTSAVRVPRPETAASQQSPERVSFLHLPASTRTLEGFRAWIDSPEAPKQVRATFISGEIFLDMSNEDPRLHVLVKGEITYVVQTLNRAGHLGELYIDGVRLVNVEADLVSNPDGCFYYWKTLKNGRIRIVQREGEESFVDLQGSLDWVLEVVSRSSATKDTQRLREAYHRAGIAEYWLVDVQGESVDFQILTWRKKGYVAAPIKDGWQKSRVFGREFRLVRQRTETNHITHVLEVR